MVRRNTHYNAGNTGTFDSGDLMRRYEKLKRELADIGFICNGTLMSTYRKCGRPGCACSDDEEMRHGPYLIWTRKENGKTVTRSLPEKQATLCRQYMENFRRMESVIEEIKKISVQMIEQRSRT